jgi:gamma-glutamyl AIG2-like cyclotransferase
MTDLVFAYGSLLGLEPTGRCTLRDHARGWDVAMDNTKTIPGYKFYVDPQTGERPAVYVVFLAIRPELGASVPGAVFAADDALLAALDARERN